MVLRAVSAGVPSGDISVETGQVNVQMEGVDTLSTQITWTLYGGKIVSILFTGNSIGTSNSTELAVPSGSFPVSIRPTNGPRYVPISLVDNNTIRIGRADIPDDGGGAAGGILFLVPDADGSLTSGFTATGLKGISNGAQITYEL